MEIYTITKRGIEAHRVIRKTETGWTVLANWSDCGARCHIKENPLRRMSVGNCDLTYTATGKDEAVMVANKFTEYLEHQLRDLESSKMKFESNGY